MEQEKRVYGPYVPKLKYDNEITYRVRKKVAGKCYRSENAMLKVVEIAYRSKIARRRRVIRRNMLLYQVKLESGMTVEISYMDVGIKGYYVRYSKVKIMKWRDKKIGRRLD